ncbi:hypothetical protein BUALT_Bualt02G0093700 [Buddleja alternifolia]|uniref:SAM domain-containing protein n=1 Tax=Buddleja alternifolia TaxID=168488 RepID=A0AAV6Y0D7_9LAMI|nr:hypothetical protein BUALT_Bualt02G0093700 [Buddleja alternifolia]
MQIEIPKAPAPRIMRNGGGDELGTKRQRRPNVRLQQPYYDNPGHRKLQQQWEKGFKKDSEVARKPPRTLKTLMNVNNSKESDCDGDKMEDDDDDVAIGSWKNFKSSKSRRKRARPSISRNWVSVGSHGNQDQENQISHLSGGDDEISEEQREGDENLGGNGINRNFEPGPSSPNRHLSFGDGKLSDDDDNVGVNGETTRRSRFRNNQNSGEMRSKDGDGVGMWLNELGLGKYLALFEVHEVDDEVLPFLTLDDLKDMGINAVGLRRRMYCSIQKLGTGFS